MAEYAVTALRYTLVKEGTIEERTKVAEAFLSELADGTPMLLVPEPDNTEDANAIAVYTTEARKVGHIKHESCWELHPLLETANGMLQTRVSRNDGHVTFFVEIPEVQEIPLSLLKFGRMLPESPLPKGIALPFTEEERTLQVVAPLLCGMDFTAENAGEWLKLSKAYMPLSRLSLCREDDCWRDRILKKFRAAMKLELSEEEERQLEQFRNELVFAQRDFHRTGEHWQLRVFDAQLQRLKAVAEQQDGLFERFENYINQGNDFSAQLARLKGWFAAMPRASLCDFTNRQKLAAGLNYQGVNRQDLYDVYAALLLLERYQGKQELLVEALRPIFFGNEQDIRDFLAGIQDMKPKQITDRVNRMVRERKISDQSCHRDLWKVLHDFGLYKPTESNWNQQVI